MRTPLDLNRRQLFQTAALGACGLSLPATAAALSSRAPGKPNVGCLSWCFHSLAPGADPEPGLDIVGRMGFDGVEAIVTALKQAGFNGFASVEQDKNPGDPDMAETCRNYVRIIRGYS